MTIQQTEAASKLQELTKEFGFTLDDKVALELVEYFNSQPPLEWPMSCARAGRNMALLLEKVKPYWDINYDQKP